MNHEGSPPTKPPSCAIRRPLVRNERRTARRYLCPPAALVQLDLIQAGNSLEGWAANLSEEGVALSLLQPLEIGSSLIVRMRGCQPLPAVVAPARVVHATKEIDGSWRIGCKFEKPLDPETVDALL